MWIKNEGSMNQAGLFLQLLLRNQLLILDSVGIASVGISLPIFSQL